MANRGKLFGRAGQAIARLLRHASTNRHDAQLFAGLVHACRYCGLYEQAIAAHGGVSNVMGAGCELTALPESSQVTPPMNIADGSAGWSRHARPLIDRLFARWIPPRPDESLDWTADADWARRNLALNGFFFFLGKWVFDVVYLMTERRVTGTALAMELLVWSPLAAAVTALAGIVLLLVMRPLLVEAPG